MLIVYAKLGPGWAPITYMVHLAARLLEAELIQLDYKAPRLLEKLESLILKRKKVSGGEKLLLICSSATELLLLLQLKDYRKRFSYIAAWVIDSFWIDRIPKFAKTAGFFDHIFITTNEDVDHWSQITHTPTTWLPFGSDVLCLGGTTDTSRKWDLTRIGRQPTEWDNDEVTQIICSERQINFHGRPPPLDNAIHNQEALMGIYRQSKYALAFSNIVNPTSYTHPTRAYLTARWVDALACGSIVAGIAPKESSIDKLLWDGATLEFESIEIEHGIKVIEEALPLWKPEQARNNYQKSLVHLDWRWRFAEIVKIFEISPQSLLSEIDFLEQKIESQTNSDFLIK